MKKLLLVFLIPFAYHANSQCNATLSATSTAICPGDSVTLTAGSPASPLTTTFSAGNNHRGNMFDIVATNTVTIESFEAHPMGTTDYEIYYRVGSHVGFETNSAGWTLVGTATNVAALPQGTPTPIPINVGVTIPAGQTYSFYVTSSNVAVSLNYTNGTTLGSVHASDGNIQFLEGSGLEYPFGGAGTSVFTPRVWNGIINYSTGTGSFLWSTGETTDQITVAPTSQTTYSVDITLTGCPTTTENINIDVLPGADLDLGADIEVCQGEQVTLDAGAGYASYSWNNGFYTTQTISVFPGTNYIATVSNASGCTATDTIAVSVGATPTVDLGPNIDLCANEMVTIDALNAGASFDWNTSDTTQVITVGPGTYSVVVTDTGSGCFDSDDITINELPLPIVDLGADSTFCESQAIQLNADTGFASYLWSTNETTESILLTGTNLGVGTHTISVTVTDSLGCENSDDIVLTVDGCLGVNEETIANILVYPNPVSTLLTIELDENSLDGDVVVYSLDGSIVAMKSIKGTVELIDFQDLSKGAYIVEIRNQFGNKRMTVIKN